MTHPNDNPLLQRWDTPFQLPPFERIHAEHFVPAFASALPAHRLEVEAIATSREPPTFDNTVAALDRAGSLLARVSGVFHNLCSSETSAALQAAERTMAPRLAAHHAAIALDPRLFARVDAVFQARATLGLDAEALRLVERTHLQLVLAGAALAPDARERLQAISAELATLLTQFGQNVLHDESTWTLTLDGAADLAGLPPFVVDAAREAAQQRGLAGHVITLSRSLVVPFLTFSDRRDLRQRAFEAWTTRGEHAGEHDNRPLIDRILTLRAEQARLLGHASYAHFALTDRMARTPAAVDALLRQVWAPARARALEEAAALQAQADARGDRITLEPWDWRYYAEQVRKARHDFDEAELKPYLSLEAVTAAAFDCAGRLFGIRFVARPDLKAYHPDVRVYEVLRGDALVGLFLADNFARPTKRSGAWMSAYRLQWRTGGDVRPIIVNNNNFAQGAPTLLSPDDARTLFHEFGHGLHGLLSDVTYQSLAGTRVLRDFVELPSQLFEHWFLEPEVLARHARHWQTGAPIPRELIDRMLAARRFNQGFETVETVSCMLLDMELHAIADPTGLDLDAFERAALARLQMPRQIVLRHRLPHFQHLFSGNAYAAGYYVYLWAEVLDADGFAAFNEAGDVFDPATAQRLLQHVYAAGNTVEPGEAYRRFRGRDAQVGPMLEKKGLVGAL